MKVHLVSVTSAYEGGGGSLSSSIISMAHSEDFKMSV